MKIRVDASAVCGVNAGGRRHGPTPTRLRDDGVVQVGMTVVLKIDEGIESFVIADEWDGRPSGGIISSMCPLARALVGRRPGETVEVAAPKGHRYCVKILSLLR